MTEKLVSDLTARLRDLLREQPATEAELRSLTEQAHGWTRTLEGQVRATEERLHELTADAESTLSEMAAELRRLESLRPELREMRRLLGELEQRARELRTAWLLHQAESARPS